MSVKLCIGEILEAAERAGKRLTDREAKDLLDFMQKRVDRRSNGIVTQSLLDELLEEGQEAARRAKVNAAIIKRNRLINAKVYLDLRTKVINSKNPREALAAMLVGDLKETAKNGGVSIDAARNGIFDNALGALAADLQKNGTIKLFQSSQMDGLVYRELFDGIGSTGNKQAESIAKSIRKTQRRLLKRKNRAGANITDLPEYVVRQNHDVVLMKRAGKIQWVQDILPLLDADRTFKNLESGETAEDFLGKIYDNLVTGNHMKTDQVGTNEGLPDPELAFKGPANLAKKLGQDRVLHFKNGESAFGYAKKYSRSTLAESVLNSIGHDAQSIALLETFGTNPRAMFDRILKDAGNAARDRGEKFDDRMLNNFFKELDGTTQARGAGNAMVFGVDFAGISSGFRMLQNMSGLGFAVISSISDIASKANYINRATGRGLFRSYAIAMKDIFSQFGSAEQKELAYLLSVGSDNFMGDVHARFGANDSVVGVMAKMHQLFFKLNGMQFWNNSQRVGIARMLAADLAVARKKGFAKLNKQQQQILSYYGIGSDELDLFRDLDMRAVDGRDYLTPEVVDSIPDSRLDKYIVSREPQALDITDNLREQYRDQLRTRIASYYTESADTAIPTPGARERAYMNLGTLRGTVLGEALRAMMQFKSFPITFVTKGLTKQFYGKGGVSASGFYGVAQMMIGMTIMGYVAMSLKDILKGKEPRWVFDEDGALELDVFKAAFLQGGGAGIYGDLLFGEYNRYGQSFFATVGGPAIGQAESVAKLYAKFRDGDGKAGDITKLAASNTPFINLFYTKAAIDYLFMYGIAEWDDPGKLRRLERKMKKEEDREFLLPPSEYAIQF